MHSHEFLPSHCMLYTQCIDNSSIFIRKLWLQYLLHGTLIGSFHCMTDGRVHVALNTSFKSNRYYVELHMICAFVNKIISPYNMHHCTLQDRMQLCRHELLYSNGVCEDVLAWNYVISGKLFRMITVGILSGILSQDELRTLLSTG